MKRFLLLSSLLLSSCSVMMASKMNGLDLDSIQNIHSRAQLIALADPIEHVETETGEIIETYKILEQKGSIARAFMHGMLDLGTGFLWEFAGTPIESALTQKKYISFKVTFDSDEQIKKIELF